MSSKKIIPSVDWGHGLKTVKTLTRKHLISEFLTTIVQDDSIDPPQRYIAFSTRVDGAAGLNGHGLIEIKPPNDYKGSNEEWAEYVNEKILQEHIQRAHWGIMQVIEAVGVEVLLRAHWRQKRDKGLSEGLDMPQLEDEILTEKRDYLKRVVESFSEETKRRLDISDGRKSPIKFFYFEYAHEQAKAIWSNAKDYSDWLGKKPGHLSKVEWETEMVRKYPHLPVDLIYGLRPPDEWPADLRRMLDRKGSVSNLYAISLEFAARYSGFPLYRPFGLSIRQLQTRLDKSKLKQ